MQPYLFPYLGYWQLINAVDTFVIYDDVNFIKQGYINRNSVLSIDKAQRFTLELTGASSFKMINEVKVGANTKKLLKTIKHNYLKSPYFEEVFPLVQKIFGQEERNLAKYIGHSLQEIADYLQISTELVYSSAVKKKDSLKAEDKVIDICTVLKADTYVNSIGGRKLYNKHRFKEKGIELKFLSSKPKEYKQFKSNFVPGLSIIDIMMFNSKADIKIMLNEYELE